jgi:hypothetical protein
MVPSIMDGHRRGGGVLMIRVWADRNARSGFRARVVQVSPPSPGRGAAAIEIEQVSGLVTEWLQRVVSAQGDDSEKDKVE